MDTPITPEECIGKEPSIIDLQKIVELHKEDFLDLDKSFIEFYLKLGISSKIMPTYYLAGQLLTLKDEPITQQLLNKAKEIDKKRKEEYGGHCNSMEASSIHTQDRMFENLQKLLNRYYKLMIHNLYRPPDESVTGDKGGNIYQKIEEKTMIGK